MLPSVQAGEDFYMRGAQSGRVLNRAVLVLASGSGSGTDWKDAVPSSTIVSIIIVEKSQNRDD
jgi:hypothetical protein